jgi:mannose-1-phosphate guanylyltransferase/mannose-6-phosphate isomerase
MKNKVITTILSGGSGTRLWPVSRENFPKPFIKVTDGKSLIQKTYLRTLKLPGLEEILTVTNRELLFLTIDEYESVDESLLHKRFILEPIGRNTAPAIIAAALETKEKHGEDAVMLVLSADHLVQNEVAFNDAVNKAIKLANKGYLVTFGIKPDRPDTSFGYLEIKNGLVKQFIEKPNLDKAKAYIKQESFYWNAGIFCFLVKTFLNEIEVYAKKMLSDVEKTIQSSRREEDQAISKLFLDRVNFENVENNSIDYVLFEKSKKVAAVPCEIGWSDIGSWSALTDLYKADSLGNRVQGKGIFHNTQNSSIYSDKRLVSLVGVENLIVVETDDALLVVHKDHVQEIKNLYNHLKETNNDIYKWHNEVHRPWGSFTVLCEDNLFKVKLIYVKPHQELSLQVHEHRSEHWVVVKGTATIINNNEKIYLKENESTYIPKNHSHQLLNESDELLNVIEVQSGTYLGEDDIKRIIDKYKRD